MLENAAPEVIEEATEILTPRFFIQACGHRWSDIRYRGHRFPNGVCYTINSNLEFDSVEKRLPLVKTGRQLTADGMYYYSMGQLGLATHYTQVCFYLTHFGQAHFR